MEYSDKSALDMYMNRVFKFLIIGIPLIAIFAAVVFSVLKITGYYPEVKISSLIIFDGTCIAYLLCGVFFYIKIDERNNQIDKKLVLRGKIFISICEFVQWNFISYMIPSTDFWAYSMFFVALCVFFLDHKFMRHIISLISLSILLSWIFHSEELLPINDQYFYPNMALRVIVMVLSFTLLWLITYVIEKFILRELEKVADYDPLTLLYNRRTLNKKINDYIERAERIDKTFCCLMCDLDDFKKVNDTYGHDIGDKVLCQVSNTIKYAIKDKGRVYRFGGEEIFCLIKTDIDLAYEIAELIRTSVISYPTITDDKSINMTITIGLCEYKSGMTSEQLIKTSDNNLYYGKTHGKNVVIK